MDARSDGATCCKELTDGAYVNLGIGIPTLVANYIPADIGVAAIGKRLAGPRAVPLLRTSRIPISSTQASRR